jgi:hypothetical protein
MNYLILSALHHYAQGIYHMIICIIFLHFLFAFPFKVTEGKPVENILQKTDHIKQKQQRFIQNLDKISSGNHLSVPAL